MPADTAGCGYYRLIWAAEYLQAMGHDITIQYPKDKNMGLEVHFRGNLGDPQAEIIDVKIPGNADVLVMQRLSHDWHPSVIRILREKGVAMVIDMDDDMSCIDPGNSAYAAFHPRNPRTPYSWRNTQEACKLATLITVSTKRLLDVYAKHGRGHVLENFVPERYLRITAEQEKVFGWAGTTQSHPNDLQVTGGSVQKLIDSGYNFKIVGPPSNAKAAFRLKEQPPCTGVVDLFNWAGEVAKLQVALAPLAVSKFNYSKSRLKVIEAASVGVPWVASPRDEYRRFHKESGSGLLAETGKDWFTCVKQLMDDAALREDLGAKGREFMRTQTIERNAWRVWEAWERAYNIQRNGGS